MRAVPWVTVPIMRVRRPKDDDLGWEADGRVGAIRVKLLADAWLTKHARNVGYLRMTQRPNDVGQRRHGWKKVQCFRMFSLRYYLDTNILGNVTDWGLFERHCWVDQLYRCPGWNPIRPLQAKGQKWLGEIPFKREAPARGQTHFRNEERHKRHIHFSTFHTSHCQQQNTVPLVVLGILIIPFLLISCWAKLLCQKLSESCVPLFPQQSRDSESNDKGAIFTQAFET